MDSLWRLAAGDGYVTRADRVGGFEKSIVAGSSLFEDEAQYSYP